MGFTAQADQLHDQLLDNEDVQVNRYSYPAGSESGFHEHQFPARVVYVLKGGKLRLVNDDGSSRDIDVKEGMTLYVPAQHHNVINIGDSEVQLLEVEIK
uniref:cupin domain-containing protein n=1 Tax=Thaumasiovibrio occultus TaxID=1891184 RepID=UPI00131EC8C1|nr:cupin domain-containing protein [Thaumasiovibrio occultus]